MRLSTKLILAIAAPLLAVGGAMAWYLVSEFEERFKDVISAQQFALATQTVVNLDDMIIDRRRIIAMSGLVVAQALQSGGPAVRVELRRYGLLHQHFPMGVFLTDERGQVIEQTTDHPQLPAEPPFQAAVAQAIASGAMFVTQPYLPPVQALRDTPRIAVLHPIQDTQGKVVRVLVGVIDALSPQFTGSILALKVGKTGYAYLYTADRMMIVHPDPQRILKQDIPPGANAMIDRAIGGFEGAGIARNSRGVPMLIAMKRMTSTGWILGVTYPLSEAFAPVVVVRQTVLAVTLGGTLLTLLLVGLLLRNSTKPLLDLAERIGRSADAADGVEPLPLPPVSAGTTTAALARAYNRMVERIRSEQLEQHKARQQLERNEAFLRSVTDTMGEGLLVRGEDGLINFVNPQACTMLGFAAHELIGHESHALFHHHRPDGKPYPKEECSLDAVMQSGGAHLLEDHFWRKDGSPLPVSLHITPILDDGRLLGSVTSFRDITEQQRAEQALRASQEVYSTLVENLGLGIALIDRDFRLLMSNRTMHEFEFCLSDSASHVCRPVGDGGPTGGAALRTCAHCPVQRSLQSGRREVVEVRGQRADGSPYWATHCALPYRDEQGAVVGHIIVIEDITQRKEDARALQEGEERFRSIAEAASDAIVVADSTGALVYWNHGATNTFGYTAAEAIGMPLVALVPQHHRSAHEAGVERAAGAQARHGGSRRAELTALHKDGHEFPIDLSVSTWRASDGLYVSGIVRDITERRRFEQALIQAKEQADASARVKSEFLAHMSHEIRTPMNGILGMTELVLDSPLQPEQREHLELVDSSARSLLTIIDDVLDFSKIEAGRLDLESVPFDLRRMLAETLGPLALRAQQKGLQLVQHCDDAVPQRLVGDPARLRQVIVNLVGNAIKFTEVGTVGVHVAADGDWAAPVFSADGVAAQAVVGLRFSIRDSGVGIPADKLDSIFEAFVQADSAINRKFGGTGLGLAISSRLVQLMGGRLDVHSAPGEGSTFEFGAAFGLDAEGSSRPTASAAHAPLPLPAPRAMSVLLAEDNPVNQRFALGVLRKAGHEVVLAQNGREAVDLALARTPPFDVVLMDIQMPVLDGFSATAELRRLGITTPVIALTAHAMQGFREQCLAAGMCDYLSKPVRSAELLTKLHALGASPSPMLLTETPLPEVQAEDEPVIDLAVVHSITDGDDVMLRTMAGMVAAQVRQDLPRLREQCERGDTTALAQAVHRLKGSLATVGATAAKAECVELEVRLRAGMPIAPGTGMQKLEERLARTVEQLDRMARDTT